MHCSATHSPVYCGTPCSSGAPCVSTGARTGWTFRSHWGEITPCKGYPKERDSSTYTDLYEIEEELLNRRKNLRRN